MLAQEQWGRGGFVGVAGGRMRCGLCPAWQVPVVGLRPAELTAVRTGHLLTVHRHALDPGYAAALAPRGGQIAALLG